MGYSSVYSSPKSDSYNSPKPQAYNSPKPEAYESQRPTVVNGIKNGVAYSYEIGSKRTSSLKDLKNIIVEYIELLERIGEKENELESLKNERQRLEEQIKNDPESSKFISILGQLSQENKEKRL